MNIKNKKLNSLVVEDLKNNKHRVYSVTDGNDVLDYVYKYAAGKNIKVVKCKMR